MMKFVGNFGLRLLLPNHTNIELIINSNTPLTPSHRCTLQPVFSVTKPCTIFLHSLKPKSCTSFAVFVEQRAYSYFYKHLTRF